MLYKKNQPIIVMIFGIITTLLISLLGGIIGAKINSTALASEAVHLRGHILGLGIILIMVFLSAHSTPIMKKKIETVGSILIIIALMFAIWEILSHEHTAPTFYWGPILASALSFCANLILERCIHKHTHNKIIYGLCTFARSHMYLSGALLITGVINLVYKAHWPEEVAKLAILVLISYNIFKIYELRHNTA